MALPCERIDGRLDDGGWWLFEQASRPRSTTPTNDEW
jgi:hypothetical protein